MTMFWDLQQSSEILDWECAHNLIWSLGVVLWKVDGEGMT
jgi:hypothetical protein